MTQRLVPLRPLAVTELLDGAVRVVWARRRTVFLVAAPFAVVVAAVELALARARVGDGGLGLNPASIASAALLPTLVGTVLTALLAPSLSSAVTGVPLDAAAAARPLMRRLPSFLGLTVLLTAGLALGTALLVVPGVLLWGAWAVAAPAATLERLGPLRALRRSRELVMGSFGRVWGARALGWAVTRVLAALVVVPFTLLASLVGGGHVLDGASVDRPLPYLVVAAVGQLVGAVLTAPVSSAVDVLLYIDLRMRREGMDLVMTLPPVPV